MASKKSKINKAKRQKTFAKKNSSSRKASMKKKANQKIIPQVKKIKKIPILISKDTRHKKRRKKPGLGYGGAARLRFPVE